VVLGGVRLTSKTPTTISPIPTHRIGGTDSPSHKYPSSGTTAYDTAENGITKL
jgi:hypothetical protein